MKKVAGVLAVLLGGWWLARRRNKAAGQEPPGREVYPGLHQSMYPHRDR